MMPPKIHAFQATTESFGSWKTQGETKSQIPRSRFVQSSQRLACPPPRGVPYDDVMTTSYFENVRSSCVIKKGVSLIEINRANPLSITPIFRMSPRLGCEIASNCDPFQGCSISLIACVNPLPGWVTVGRERYFPIPIFRNEINALGDFRGGVKVARDFARRDQQANFERLRGLLRRPPQLRMPAGLGGAQPIFLAPNIVARHRDDVLAFRELYLEYHQGLFAERHFRAGEIELPHPHEAPIIDALDLLAMRQESLAPSLQRFGVMQAQDLDIGDEQAVFLYPRQHLRHRRTVGVGPVRAADRM